MSTAIIGGDGGSLSIYCKSRIPDHHENHHFSPGNSRLKVCKTRYATIDVGICLDLGFPQCDIQALFGAKVQVTNEIDWGNSNAQHRRRPAGAYPQHLGQLP